MRICYICGDGRSTHIQRWMAFFAKRGHKVSLFTLQTGDIKDIKEIVYDKQRYFPKTATIQQTLKIRHLIKDFRPDILHAHVIDHNSWLGALSNFHPFVLTAWGSDLFIGPYAGIKTRLRTWYTLQKADLVTGDSQVLLKAAINLGARKDRAHLIQFGVDTDLFKPGINSAKWKEKLEIDDERVIFSPRSLRPIYNIDIIIKAFHKVQEENKKTVLVLKRYLQSGDDPYEMDLKRLIYDLGVTEKVKFVGQIPYDEMPELYNIADVVVSIPSSDATPMSVLEAMASGPMVIVSDLPSLREWIQDNYNGFIVPLKDESATCDAILKCLNTTPSICNEFSKRNRDAILDRADQIKNMEKMETLYYKLLK